jgi:hypothetical protein
LHNDRKGIGIGSTAAAIVVVSDDVDDASLVSGALGTEFEDAIATDVWLPACEAVGRDVRFERKGGAVAGAVGSAGTRLRVRFDGRCVKAKDARKKRIGIVICLDRHSVVVPDTEATVINDWISCHERRVPGLFIVDQPLIHGIAGSLFRLVGPVEQLPSSGKCQQVRVGLRAAPLAEPEAEVDGHRSSDCNEREEADE